MLGIYSNLGAGLNGTNTSVTHYEIRADGSFVVGGSRRCGMEVRAPEEHRWKRAGEGAIEVEFIGGELDGRHWRISPGDDCHGIRIQPEFLTQPEHDYQIGRGEVCMRPEPCPPESVECFCQTYWCDAPPPACESSSE